MSLRSQESRAQTKALLTGLVVPTLLMASFVISARTTFTPEPVAFESCGRNLRCATVKVRSLEVAGIELEGGRLRAVHTTGASGSRRLEVRQALSTIPISQLVRLIQPQAPESVLSSACALKFRSMIPTSRRRARPRSGTRSAPTVGRCN